MRSFRILTCLCLALAAGHAQAQQPETVPIDRIVAVANDGVILHSELERAVQQIKDRLQGRMELPPQDILGQQVLERLLLTKLQLQLAEQNGVQASENEVDNALEQMAARNNLSLAQLRDRVVADGYSFAGFRADVRDQLIIQKLQERVAEARISVADSEVQIQLAKLPNQNREYRLATILISVPEGADAQAIRDAADEVESLYREIRAGRDFAQAAIAQSDAQNALQGGDLGWRRAEEIPPVFIDLVEGMEPGEVSEPLRGAGGFYLIQLKDEREAQPVMVLEKHARHIVISPDELATDQEAYQQVAELRRQIVEQDADFATVAREHSDDTLTAARGGDLGWFGPQAFGTRFDQVLADLEPNEISTPFRTAAGWHIIQLLGRRQVDRTEELRSQRAREAIYQRKRDEQIETWLRQLRAEAYVDIRL